MKNGKNLIDTSTAKSCACANIRQTDFVVTQFYDGILAPGGVSALQFSILGILSSSDSITTNQLAQIMDMDRVALSRHVKILADEELITYGESGDQYTRRLLLTEEGEEVIERTWPLWQEAQRRIEINFGQDRFQTLLKDLQAVRAALNSPV